MSKFIFVTGGVVSSLGKGIAVASIARILKSRGISVSVLKLDPYLNVDPGTMSPYQHGEVFVTGDGSETDLDLGHYERFIGMSLTGASNLTAGKIYSDVIAKERKGEFLGGTIQVVPHVTDAIKSHMFYLSEKSQADVIVVEVGGTVGDIEGLPFLEAIRQMRNEVGSNNVFYVHLTYLPYVTTTNELKRILLPPVVAFETRLIQTTVSSFKSNSVGFMKVLKSISVKFLYQLNVPHQ